MKIATKMSVDMTWDVAKVSRFQLGKSPEETFHMIAHEKNPGWLGYIGDYTTQVYRDYHKPLRGSLQTNQYNKVFFRGSHVLKRHPGRHSDIGGKRRPPRYQCLISSAVFFQMP